MDAVTAAMVSGLDSSGSGVSKGSKPPDMLKAITKPFTKLVVQIDKKVGIPITGSVGYSDTLGTREKCYSIQLSL